jgi:CTP:molybdopterin cytidylyltransferase MocA
MSKKISFSAVILAAGYSKRMGSPKFALKMPDGMSFLETLIAKYLSIGCTEIAVVANPDNYREIKITLQRFSGQLKSVKNPDKNSSKLKSVIYGCRALVMQQPAFIQPIDNPMISAETLQVLLQNLIDADYAFPVFATKGGHPVIVSKAMAGCISELKEANITLREFFKTFEGKKVDVCDDTALANINTPHDLKKFLFYSHQIEVNAGNSKENIRDPGSY